jgi:hypothetical protein
MTGSLMRIGAVATLVALATLVLSSAVSAQRRAASFDEVKAAFVYQFANFVTWPEDAFETDTDPMTIGILGNEEMVDLLREAVSAKTVGLRPILVRQLSEPGEAAECHIVFLDGSDDRRVDEYLAVLTTKAVLTVSDDSNFTEEGGIIRIFEQQNKPKVEINVDEAKRSNLTISSKLLSIAKIVNDPR